MGLDVDKLLCEYFSKQDVQDALRDIGEPTTGTKEELVDELTENWESHNRDKYDLLDFTEEFVLQDICSHYNLDDTTADHSVLKRRIKKAKLLDSGGRSIKSSKVDNSRFYPKKPEIRQVEKSETRDVHFHFSTITQSKVGKLGITLAIIGIAVSIIIALVV